MKFKQFRNALIVTLAVAAGLYALYRLIYRLLEKAMLMTKANSAETPAGAGLEFEELSIQSGDHRLKAWYVPAVATNDVHKAVLVFHGIDECIADWIPALGYLHEHGFGAMVFDYSGFGDSQGQATVDNLRQDAPSAYAVFLEKIPAGARKILLGYSLGSGVLLDAISGFAVQPDGVTLAAAYTSGRDAAVCLGPLPSWLTWVIPDVYNNVQAVRRLSLPLLIIHSRADRLFPTWMPAKMLAAAAGPKSLVMLEGLEHGDMVDGKAAEYLAPLIESNFPPE